MLLGREAAVDGAPCRRRRARRSPAMPGLQALLGEHLGGGRDHALAVAHRVARRGRGCVVAGGGGHALTARPRRRARRAARRRPARRPPAGAWCPPSAGISDRHERGDQRDGAADEERGGVAVVGRQAGRGQHAAGQDRPRVTCEPSDDPIERTTRVEAGRLAGLLERHRVDDQVRHRREGEADADRSDGVEHQDLELRCRARAPISTRPTAVISAAEGERHPAADRARRAIPESGPTTSMTKRAGQHQQPGGGGAQPEAVAAWTRAPRRAAGSG